MKPAVLAYWDIRGMAQPIRLLLEYTKMAWVDKFYVCGEKPHYDRSQWLNEKEKLGLDFPNLPYFIDGDVKMSQSLAILRYIARKHKLVGENDKETIAIEVVEGEVHDMRSHFSSLCYNPDFESLKSAYLENVQVGLQRLSKFHGNQRPYIVGEKIKYVDFLVYETLDQLRILEPNILKKWPNLEDYTARIENIEQIAKYFKSVRFVHRLNSRMALFGA